MIKLTLLVYFIGVFDRLDKKKFKTGSQLKVVSSMSAGVDHIDKDELKARKIILTNTPDVLNAAVADVAILLMVGTARRLPERIKEVKSYVNMLGF